jgi:ABC-type multidrug transport system ATPase subunit
MSSQVIAEFKNVGFRYGRADRWAVRELSLRVVRGEVLGLVGPNGSGKTTIYRLLLGFLVPQAGWLTIAGERPADYRVRNGIGYLPERVRLPGDVRGREFGALMARLAGHSPEKPGSWSDALSKALGLVDRSSSPLGSLSHGYQKRVGLLAALLGDPQLLLLDEPANGLDPDSQGILRSTVRALQRRGRTVIVSSHNLAELERICDRLVILQEGNLIGRCSREGLRARADVWVVRLSDDGKLRRSRTVPLGALGGVRLAADEIGFRERRGARDFAHRMMADGAVVETIERRRFDLEFLYHSIVQGTSTGVGSTDESES